jgi:pyruvate formate lyase activating enzyme
MQRDAPLETLKYDKLDNHIVRCRICSHYCRIEPGEKGICRVRQNRDGRLFSLIYKQLVAQSIDPIEKKPIYHLKPGSSSYSIAGIGCNFQCTFCQNASIAQEASARGDYGAGVCAEPAEIVAAALNSGCKSISYTYTEPTVFLETALETARLAYEQGLYNIFVTNGFMSKETLTLLLPYLSAANVDLKAFDDRFYRQYCNAKLAPVKKSIETMKEAGVLVELTTLLIPGLNDGDTELSDMAQYIANRLGCDTPWHISRFHPCHRMTDRGSTTVSSLERAWRIGKEAGLNYVYIGNVPGSAYENTLCARCGETVIERYGYRTRSFLKDGGACPKCGSMCAGLF